MGFYIFDKDNTLIKLKPNLIKIGRPVTRVADQEVKEGVVEKLAELRGRGDKIAIASNQRAVSKGIITLEQAEELMEDAAKKVGGIDAWRICPFDENARSTINGRPNPYKLPNHCKKPKPGMLIELMEEMGFSPNETTMIGDSWRDRKAAENAKVKYIHPKEFFKE